MTNVENGEQLIKEGQRVLRRDVAEAYKDGSYNICVRRAQEAVELMLKGFLQVLGVEYPKRHDVGAIFAGRVMMVFPETECAAVEQVRDISRRLTNDREPSFYFERLYSEADARKAQQDAQQVSDFVAELLTKFKQESEDDEKTLSEEGKG